MGDEEGCSSPLATKGLLLGELQERKYKLTPLEEGTKVRSKDGSLHIERFVDGVLVKEDAGREAVPTFLTDAARGRSELFPKRFNSSTNRWVISQQGETDAVKFESNGELSKLRFVTFNVWFDDYHKLERAQGLLDLIHKLEPHFVCFQECTRTFLEIVKKQSWVCDHYALSDSEGSTIHPYGVLLLSRLPVHKFYTYKFKTIMGRRLLMAEVHYSVNGGETKKMSVSTAHLESLKEAQSRIQQLEIIFRTLNATRPAAPTTDTTATTTTTTTTSSSMKEFASAFHMGDFNFGADRTAYPENDHLSPEFTDCWKQLHPDDPGLTYKGDRFDKVIYRTTDFALETIDIIGNTPLFEDPEDNEKVYPSDHFGLYTSFKLAEASSSSS